MTNRHRLIRLTCVAQRDLGMDEDTFRQFLLHTTGKASRKDMALWELEKVVTVLKTQGFKVRPGGKGRALATGGMASKLRALWLVLYEKGVVRDPSEAALCAWASNSRANNVTTDLGMMSDAQLAAAIERAKKWAKRAERETGHE
jgi:phage gp16-like protein